MVCLEVVVISYGDHKVEELLNIVRRCNVVVNEYSLLFRDDKQLASNAPNFREGRLKLDVKLGRHEDHLTIQEAYNHLTRDWIRVTSELSPVHSRPWLVLHHPSAFRRVWDATQMNLRVDQLALGTLSHPSQFYVHFRWPGSVAEDEVSVTTAVVAHFFHDVKTCEIYFGKLCKMILKYSAISGIIVSYGAMDEILINLTHPLLVFKLEEKNNSSRTWEVATRVETIPFCETSLPPYVFGKSTTLRLRIRDHHTAQTLVARLHFRCGTVPIKYVAMSNKHIEKLREVDAFSTVLPDFECGYLLTAVVYRNFVLQLQNLGNWKDFRDFLELWAVKDPRNLRKALVDLLRLVDDGVMMNYRFGLQLLLKYHCQKAVEEESPMPRAICMVSQAILTPTRIILYPPEIICGNRVLRNFDYRYGLRVSFRDDDFNRFNKKSLSQTADRVIRQPMLTGIDIAGRHYDFLAWSNSQLREHGVWMYAPDAAGNTAVNIRQWMGDFSTICSVPKFMARMGQCFSQTEDTVAVPQLSHVTEEDIKGGVNPKTGNPYVFSDGVGQISESLVEKVCQKMELPNKPSAFQMRYAGYKGMLVVNPKLQDHDIVFRNSMLKFPCGSNRLEIVKTSAPVAVFLNRQLITILDYMRIPSRVFLKLQEDMLMALTDMFIDEDKAARQLASTCPLPLDFVGLVQSGISLTTDPLFRAMLLAFHRSSVEGVKTKARIAVDPTLGRYMFGVLDETKSLEYGQVFVQYTTNVLEKDGGDTTVLEGRVMVTKNPCLFPGDVRVFQAVDIPDLHHIVDCVVFPQKEPRPHPDEMAGSDLDGDEYTVIWDKDLIFSGDNAPPEHYSTAAEVQRSSGPIEVVDMVDALCNYISNDHIGVLGNAHLAMADNPRHGLNSPVCRSLAHKFSLAVDAAKTGVRLEQEPNERVTCYPDFMEKGGRATSYRSTSSLGKLYRVCRDFEEVNRCSSYTYTSVQMDLDLMYPGWIRHEKSAEVSRNTYTRRLRFILSSFGVTHEAEAIAKAFTKLHSHIQERKDKADIEDIIAKAILNLWMKTKQEFWDQFGGIPSDDSQISSNPEVLRKASSWYMVTYRSEQGQQNCLSFPWIVARQLATIKMKQMPEIERTHFLASKPFVQYLDVSLSASKLQKPNQVMMNLLNGFSVDTIPHDTLLLSTKLVVQWAKHCQLLPDTIDSSPYQQVRGITQGTLVRLFLYRVDEKVENEPATVFTPVSLFLDFLQYCVSFRFMSKQQANKVLPFTLPKSKYLGKLAMATFHSIAIEGHLGSAGIAESGRFLQEAQEMDPTVIPLRLSPGLQENDFHSLKTILRQWTGVYVVNVRSKQQSLMISAAGPLHSIRNLQVLLQKDAQFLQHKLNRSVLE